MSSTLVDVVASLERAGAVLRGLGDIEAFSVSQMVDEAVGYLRSLQDEPSAEVGVHIAETAETLAWFVQFGPREVVDAVVELRIAGERMLAMAERAHATVH